MQYRVQLDFDIDDNTVYSEESISELLEELFDIFGITPRNIKLIKVNN